MKSKIIGFIFLSLICAGYGAAAEKEIPAVVDDYVQKMVVSSLIQGGGDIISRAQVALVPAMAYMAAQQIALQSFKQEETLKILREAHQSGMKEFADIRDQKYSSQIFAQKMDETIKGALEPIYSNEVYRAIVTQIIQQSLQEQNKIYMQEMQRRAAIQQAVAQEVMQEQARQAVIQSAIQQQVRQAAVQNTVQQQIQQAAVVQQMQQVAMQQVINQEMLKQRQALMEQAIREEYIRTLSH